MNNFYIAKVLCVSLRSFSPFHSYIYLFFCTLVSLVLLVDIAATAGGNGFFFTAVTQAEVSQWVNSGEGAHEYMNTVSCVDHLRISKRNIYGKKLV